MSVKQEWLIRIALRLKWLSASLWGVIVASELGISLPLFVVFVFLNYTEDTLTPLWALWIAFVCSLVGIAWAILFWYTFLLPFTKLRNRRR